MGSSMDRVGHGHPDVTSTFDCARVAVLRGCVRAEAAAVATPHMRNLALPDMPTGFAAR